jgi:hypothetical protein
MLSNLLSKLNSNLFPEPAARTVSFPFMDRGIRASDVSLLALSQTHELNELKHTPGRQNERR